MNLRLKIGDNVAVIDDTIKGIVHAVNGKSIVVKTQDGFLATYTIADLVLIAKDQKEYSKYIDIQHEHLLEKKIVRKKPIQKKKTKNRNQPPLEVDLHVDQLTKSTKGMSNHDMLTLQLETAKRQLEFAMLKKIQRIVFIHGVGEGILKKELEFLLANYNVDVYAASFQKYGFGATEVYIYQNKN